MFWFFGHEACGILGSQPGIEPTSPALEGEALMLDHPAVIPDAFFSPPLWFVHHTF